MKKYIFFLLFATLCSPISGDFPPSGYTHGFPLLPASQPVDNVATNQPPRTCTTTRAGELMQFTLELVRAENGNSSEPCVYANEGPGIFGVPSVARAYRSVAVGMYNVWAKFQPTAVTTFHRNDHFPRLNGTEERKQQMITYAAFYVLQYLLPEGVQRNNTMQFFNSYYHTNFNSADAKLAQNITESLIAQLKVDGFNQEGCYADTTGYEPSNPPTDLTNSSTIDASRLIQKEKYHWSQEIRDDDVPKPRPFQDPQASKGTPFISPETLKSLLPPAPNFTTFDAQYQELAEVQLNDTKKIIVEYWADGPNGFLEPGTWQSFALEVIIRKCYNLDDAVKLLFATTNAVYDAAIVAWTIKRSYDTARASTFVPTYLPNLILPNAFLGHYCGYGNISGEQWQPYQAKKFITPPFPGYVSGHATFSRTAAEVLRLFTGSNTIPGGPFQFTVPKGGSIYEPLCDHNDKTGSGASCTFMTCRVDSSLNSENNFTPKEDITLMWSQFTDLSDESSLSRLYAGVHIGDDTQQGMEAGKKLGPEVYKTAQNYFTGYV
ncbi:14662_t:CDS:2 [Ambispora leptoticha]|uniref:14662_t:CDS:1 n=1 Tax=Ambispora leptoticha TaxID=144679 RepID=A0A9N9FZY3_9GLOM|nr:14662_t:CDS:2 [Ambispora leptoticha]